MFLHQKLGYNYEHIDINDSKKAINTLAKFLLKAHEVRPDFTCYDTETDGLNLIKAKPFLVAIGFDKNVVTLDYDKEIMNVFWKMYLLKTKEGNESLQDYDNYISLFSHNAKFDFHMMENGGSPIPEDIKIMDSITIARLTEYADEKVSNKLEALGTKYVADNAKFAGKIIKDIKDKINKERRNNLKNLLIDNFPEEGFGKKSKTGKYIGSKKLTNLLKDYEKRVRFIDDDNKFFKFIDENFSLATYEDVYKREPELLRNYAADDVVIEIEYIKKALPALKNVDTNLIVTTREGELIRAVSEMEKTGLKVDVPYVLNCRKDMIKYRDLLYMELEIYTGLSFSVGQHEFIKKMLYNKYKIKTDKADEKALKYIEKNTTNEEVRDVCKNILELRTLDKWISTYVDGKLNSIINGRIYTDINNSGAVSGRVSCDMQQQPKEALFDRDGKELFHPRRMFVCDEDYCLAFCDESQMELRVQAYYTMLYGKEPDLAMCRAYMPYKCHTYIEDYDGCDEEGSPVLTRSKVPFDYTDKYMLKNFDRFDWYLDEGEKVKWTPTDLHSETTRHAFPDIDPKSDEFKKKRKLGKRANFLKVYQGGVDALQDSLEIPREIAEALDKAFYKAFPRIKDYQDWVTQHLYQYGYVENLYGRRYYMNDSRYFYKGCNYLIQGTCADMVKTFEIEVNKYLKENKLKSKMVLPIHDELMLLVHKDEMFVIKEVKRIMEDVTDVVKYIPMISEPEVSYTNWAEKKEYEVK